MVQLKLLTKQVDDHKDRSRDSWEQSTIKSYLGSLRVGEHASQEQMRDTTKAAQGTRESSGLFESYLGALWIGEHAGNAADEAFAAGGVPAAETIARLLEVVLLLDDALLALPRDERVVDGVPLCMAHRVEARREVVHLQVSRSNTDSSSLTWTGCCKLYHLLKQLQGNSSD